MDRGGLQLLQIPASEGEALVPAANSSAALGACRSNVSTEDVDNMFTKKSAAAARAAAKAKAEGSASFF